MRTSRPPQWATDEAFTLVEMLVVLVIVSMGFGLVVLALTDGPADRVLEHEAGAVADWIRTATLTAAAHGQSWELDYDMDKGMLRARPSASTSGEYAVEYIVAAPVRMDRVEVAGEQLEEQSAGVAQVSVDANGRCEPHLVVLRQEGVGVRTLEVNPVTGDVAVFRDVHEYANVQVSDLVGSGQ